MNVLTVSEFRNFLSKEDEETVKQSILLDIVRIIFVKSINIENYKNELEFIARLRHAKY